MNNETYHKQIASYTSRLNRTYELWVMNNTFKMVEGAYTTKGWSHTRTVLYSNLGTARAAFTKRSGIRPLFHDGSGYEHHNV